MNVGMRSDANRNKLFLCELMGLTQSRSSALQFSGLPVRSFCAKAVLDFLEFGVCGASTAASALAETHMRIYNLWQRRM